MSYVYIAPLRDGSAFKVGKSSDPSNRLLDLSKYYEFDTEGILVINCNTDKESFNMESILHKSCSSMRVHFPFDGGTEFFEYELLDSAMGIAINVCEINNYSTMKFSPEADVQTGCDAEIIIESMSKKIRARRLLMNLTHKDLAEGSKVSTRTIARLEGGLNVSFHSMVKVVVELGISDFFSSFKLEETSRMRAGRTLHNSQLVLSES